MMPPVGASRRNRAASRHTCYSSTHASPHRPRAHSKGPTRTRRPRLDNDSHRDDGGRFKAGNPGGPGGARRKANELRRAAEEAVSTDMVRGVMRKVAVQALQG